MPKEKTYSIGVDIGGTKMTGVLFDGAHAVADYTLATPKDDLVSFINVLVALIEPLKERAKKGRLKIKGIGLGIAGALDIPHGVILESPNLPVLDGFNIVEKLKERIEPEWETALDNDANCFTLAEARVGAGRKYQNIVGVTIGTGLGGGWYYEGRIYHGMNSSSREPGQLIIDHTTGLTTEQAFHKITQSNPAILAEEAYRGDPLAEKSFGEIATLLGSMFANIATILEPEMIVVGGGVVQSSDLFLNQATKTMAKYLFNPQTKKVKIVKAKLGPLAGAIGAALLIT